MITKTLNPITCADLVSLSDTIDFNQTNGLLNCCIMNEETYCILQKSLTESLLKFEHKHPDFNKDEDNLYDLRFIKNKNCVEFSVLVDPDNRLKDGEVGFYQAISHRVRWGLSEEDY